MHDMKHGIWDHNPSSLCFCSRFHTEEAVRPLICSLSEELYERFLVALSRRSLLQ